MLQGTGNTSHAPGNSTRLEGTSQWLRNEAVQLNLVFHMECSDDLRESPHFLPGVPSVSLRVKGGSETGLIGSDPSVTWLLNESIRSFMCV